MQEGVGEPLRRAWRYVTLELSFSFLFLLYVLVLSFAGSIALHLLDGSAGGPRPYIDTLFLSASVTTTTGLLTVDISTLNVGSQVVLFILMVLGSPLLGSALYPFSRWLHVSAALARLEARAKAQGVAAASMVDPMLWRQRLLQRDSLALAMRIIAALFMASFCAGLVLYLPFCSMGGARALLDSRRVNPFWFASFHAMSTTNNVGISLLSDSMFAFRSDSYMLCITAILSIVTGVGVPMVLRGIIWGLRRLYPGDQRFIFLLNHPRMVFFNVFPFGVTFQMLIWLVLFTAYQFVSTLCTDWVSSSGALGDSSAEGRFVLSFFKAAMTRTTGFAATTVVDFSSADSFVTAFFMYIAAFPFLVAQRTTAKKLEDAKKGVLDTLFDPEGAEEDTAEAQLREFVESAKGKGDSQLSHLASVATGAVPVVMLSVLLVLYADSGKAQCENESRSIFGIIFEVASAFGNVGLSMSTEALSAVAYLSTFSKLVIIWVMVYGRMKTIPEVNDATMELYEVWGEPPKVGEGSAVPAKGEWGAANAEEGGDSGNAHLFTQGVGALSRYLSKASEKPGRLMLSQVFEAPSSPSSSPQAAPRGQPEGAGPSGVGLSLSLP